MVRCGSTLFGNTAFAKLTMQPCTYGKTYEEAIANAQEAIAGYLDYCEEEGLIPPSPTLIAA